MSGYRTPFYNKQLDDTTYSLHQWGRAADIFLDKDGNGVMDDFDGDAITRNDAVALAGVLELAKTPERSQGLSAASASTAQPPRMARSCTSTPAPGGLVGNSYSSSSLVLLL